MRYRAIAGFAVLFILCVVAPAMAQTGSPKTPAQLNTEVNTLWPDNTGQTITPHDARQTLLDIIASNASVGLIRYVVTGVNFNSANTDTPITIALPVGITRYQVNDAKLSNPSASISTATIGIFGGAGGTGAVIAANQSITVTTSSANTNNNSMSLGLTNALTEAYDLTTIYARVGTAQGSAATADVIIMIKPLT